MDKKDLRYLKRKELIDLIDKMQTDSDLVSNEEVKEELSRLKERERYLKKSTEDIEYTCCRGCYFCIGGNTLDASTKDLWFEYGSDFREWADCSVYKN